MTITFGNSTLVAGQTRNSTGSPVGPANLQIVEQPGVIEREYIGADRIQAEHLAPDHGTVSFTVTRVFATVDAALTYATQTVFTEAKVGQLTIGSKNIFGSKTALVERKISHVGVAVVVAYSFKG